MTILVDCPCDIKLKTWIKVSDVKDAVKYKKKDEGKRMVKTRVNGRHQIARTGAAYIDKVRLKKENHPDRKTTHLCQVKPNILLWWTLPLNLACRPYNRVWPRSL